MASLMGISIKAVKEFEGRDFPGYSANVYIDSKKAGTVLEPGDGGEIHLDILPEFRDEFDKRIKSYYEKYPAYYNSKIDFMNEIYELHEAAVFFKKNLKKGYPITTNLSFTKRTEPYNFEGGLIKPDVLYSVKNDIGLAKIIREYKPAEYQVYRSLDDFIIS